MLFCAGCASVNSKIPGYRMTKEGLHSVYPMACGNDVAYAVMTWYQGVCEEPLPTLVLEDRKKAGQELFSQWAEDLCRRYSAFLEMQNGVPVVKQTVTAPADIVLLKSLQSASKELSAPLSIRIPEANIPQIWYNASSDSFEQYTLWRKLKKTLPLPVPPQYDRQKLLKNLSSLSQLVVQYKQLKELLNHGEKATSLKDMSEALDRMCKALQALPKDISFQQLNDTTLLPDSHQLCKTLPVKIVKEYTRDLQKALDNEAARLKAAGLSHDPLLLVVLDQRESEVLQLLEKWRGDRCYAEAIQLEEFQKCLYRLGMTRRDYCCALLESKKDAYWEICQTYRDLRNTAQTQAQKMMKIYQGSKFKIQKMSEDVRNVYLKKLEAACQEFLPRAYRYLETNNQAGACYACCLTLEELFDPVKNALNDDLKKKQERIHGLLLQSKGILEQQKLVRTFKVGELSSAKEGIGLVYSKDLQNELKLTLRYLGLEPYVRVVPLDDKGEWQQWTYVTYGGLVAEYRADEQSVVERNKAEIWYRQPQKRLNPEYQPEAGLRAPLRQRAEYIYEQEETIQVVRVKEIERQAQIRISAINLKGPACAQDALEFSEIYRKNFVTESTDPIYDIKSSRTAYYDLKETKKVVASPKLRVDRVWGQGEMLDWARKDSLKILALQLVYYVDMYPMFLYQQAEAAQKSGNRDGAIEYLGQCYCLCQKLPLDQNIPWPELQSEQASRIKGMYQKQRAESLAMKKQLKLRIINLVMAR